MVNKINKENVAMIEANDNKVKIVDFSAVWCGPCKMVKPIFDEVSEELAGCDFLNVDVDEFSDVAGKYSIVSIPTILIIKNGEVLDRSVGFIPKDDMIDFIKKSL